MPRAAADIPESMLRIALAGGIGPVTFDRMCERFESADEIVAAPIVELERIEGVGRKRAEAIRRELDEAPVERERAEMAKHSAGMIFRGDPDYPVLLAQIPDPPVALWIRGELREQDQLAVAIVGSRRCTQYGREQAGRFASMLAQSGLTIISGGARGIDGESHRAAIRAGGRTLVISGCGLAQTYPPEHAELFARIVDEGAGALISEYPMKTAPLAQHFPRRNRIISGMALGVLLVEAAKGSGALITARSAAEDHNREVMAIPGRVDSPASLGCLRAIRDGWAAPVLDHSDVLMQLESVAHTLLEGAIASVYGSAAMPSGDGEASHEGSLAVQNLTDPQRLIVEALRDADEPMLIDQLAARAQLTMEQLLPELTILQIRRIISRRDAAVSLRESGSFR